MPTYTGSKAQAGRGSMFAIGSVAGAVVPTGLTATTVSGSPNVTAVSGAGAAVGMGVTGTGIPAGTTVVATGSGTLTLSQNASASGTVVALTFTLGYIAVGELRSADPVKGQFDKEDVSNFDSNLDKEYIKLMRDNGAPKLTGNRVSSNAGQLALVAAYNDANNAYLFQVTLPKRPDQTTTGDVYSYSALVMAQSFTVETNKAVTFDVELQITGPVTFTPGS